MGPILGPQGLHPIFRLGVSTRQFHPHLCPRLSLLSTFIRHNTPRTLTTTTTTTPLPSSQPQDPLSPSSQNQPTTQNQNPTPRRKPTTPLRLLLQTLKLLCLLHLTSTYLIHSGAVEGPSMLPTIPAHGSSVLILSLHRLGRGIEVGDLVCFKNPIAEGDAVKRVLGMEGDYVLWDTPDGPVARGQPRATGGRGARGRREGTWMWQDENNTMSTGFLGGMEKDKAMIQVPKGHVWLTGDNMTASRDSRIYGPVPLALIKGKVIAQWYPWSERQWFRNPVSGTTGLGVFRRLADVIRF